MGFMINIFANPGCETLSKMTTFEIISVAYMVISTIALAVSIGFNLYQARKSSRREQLAKHFSRYAQYYDSVLAIIEGIREHKLPQFDHVRQLLNLIKHSEKYFDNDVKKYLEQLLSVVHEYVMLISVQKNRPDPNEEVESYQNRRIAELMNIFALEHQSAHRAFMPYIRPI